MQNNDESEEVLLNCYSFHEHLFRPHFEKVVGVWRACVQYAGSSSSKESPPKG